MTTEHKKPREIYFGGEFTSTALDMGLKLVTLRRSDERYRGFKAGDEVVGICENSQAVELVIWGVIESQPLNAIDPIVLAMDGYMNLEEAVADLRQIHPRYADINENSDFTMLAIISKKTFEELSDEEKNVLLRQQEGKSFSEVVRDRRVALLVIDSITFQQELTHPENNNDLDLFRTLGLL